MNKENQQQVTADQRDGTSPQGDNSTEIEQSQHVSFAEQDNVIIFGTGTLSPWDSDIDGATSGSDQPIQEEAEQRRIINLSRIRVYWHTSTSNR